MVVVLVEGSASTCVPLRHHGLRAATTVRGRPDPLHAIPVRAGLRAIRARARGGARAGLRLSCVHLPWSRAAPAPAFHYATMACHLHHGAWPDAARPLRAIPMCRALSITAPSEHEHERGDRRLREPSEHEPEGVSFSHIWYAGTYHYAQACDCRVRICMCLGSDEPRVQQGNCSEPRSPSIFPNLRLGSRTTFVPIRPKTEAPRRAAELSQLSASAWLHAADRALRDEKKCFPLKDELLALGWASSRGTCSRWSFGGGR